METVRIRLVFEESHALSKSQRKDGLNRSWILLKPHLATVSDFSSYVLDFFLLRNACPYGLILSMDGFVLPPFESISIFNDKDIVMVKKKEEHVTALEKTDNRPFQLVKEFSGCENEPEGDQAPDSHRLEETLHAQSDKKMVCRKRRAPQTLCSSKRKKNICAPNAKCLLAQIDHRRNCTENNQSFQKDVIFSDKNLVKQKKSSNDLSDTDNSNKQTNSNETLRCKILTIKKKKEKRAKKKSSSWSGNCKNYKGESSRLQVREVDFTKFSPCTGLPKRGDIIAYRLIELSPSWTPQLSSFRAGRVTWCKPNANKIMLIPVPKYPFVFKKVVNGEPATQIGASPYGEDGSLKADYSSLIDIRIVKYGSSNRPKASVNNFRKVSLTNQSWNPGGNCANAQEKGNENNWDEILQAITAEKTESSKQVGWSRMQREVQGRSQWSTRSS